MRYKLPVTTVLGGERSSDAIAQRDPAFRAKLVEEENERLGRVRRFEQNTQDLRAELAGAGLAVDSIEELDTRRPECRAAIPILARWLPLTDNLIVKQVIACKLAVPGSKPYAPVLLHELQRTQPTGAPERLLREWLALALEMAAHDAIADDLMIIVQDRRMGSERAPLVRALGKMKSGRERIISVLTDLLSDEKVCDDAILALGDLRVVSASALVEPFLNHEDLRVRKAAMRTMVKLRRSSLSKRAARQPLPPAPASYKELSANCDLENLKPFLKRLRSVVESGLFESEIIEIADTLDALGRGQSREFALRVQFNGRRTPVRLKVVMEDHDCPDLYFFAPEDLITRFEVELHRFWAEIRA
ncbi:MAG: hypothetical protein HY013_15925 [Candidatus Solibacter usitatus]|nr:hypothetical protein [Candidatus Solibacter usitatus]